VLIGVTLLSLVLTALDFTVAYIDVLVNLLILAALLFGPRVGVGNK